MSLGFAFAFLLTLQSLQLVSTQDSNVWIGESTSTHNRTLDDWKRENNSLNLHEEHFQVYSDSMQFSGDDEYHADNQTAIAVTGQYNDNENMTLSVSGDPTIINPVTPNPYPEPSTAISSDVNLTQTNTNNTPTTTTTTSAVDISFIQNSTTRGTFMTTSPPQLLNYTESPTENSTNITVVTTTTMLDHTSIVLLNESSNASSTNINKTGDSLSSRGNIDRGLSSDIEHQTKIQAWGAILGIGVGVAVVALVIFIIVKRRNFRDFSHRKLVEDMPPDPVLRLDNSEPLDLKFDGFAYYNPGLQGGNIQMTNFPQGHAK